VPAPEGGLAAGIDRYFGVRDSSSTIGTELRGGLTTFATMAYIVMGLDRLAEMLAKSP